MPMAYERLVLKNNSAAFGWGFMTIWLAGLCLISWLFLRDGGFHQLDPAVETGIMLMFWLFGLGGAGYLFNQPRVRLSLEGGMVTLREVVFWRVREETFPAVDLGLPPIRHERDSDGDPYYSFMVATPSGREAAVCVSHDKATVEAQRDRVVAAIGRNAI